MRELRFAMRRLRKRPGRALATALALAIGIGATTAAFAAVDAVVLRDLPVERQDELVVAWRLNPERASLQVPFRTEDYEFLERGQKSLSAMAGFTAWGALPVLVASGDTEYPLKEVRVAGDFFGVLGAHPAVGRLLDRSDDVPGANQVAVVSHSAWRTRYGSDPSIVGSSLVMRDVSVTVVGVAPRGFDFPRGTDVWVPLQGAAFELHVLGRMAPGVDPPTVAADVAATFAAGQDQGVGFFSGLEPVVIGLEEQIVGSVRPVLRAALVAAVLLLLAGAANATLFLLAGGGRAATSDLAVRRALGAERLQLVGQVLADSWLVCVIGTAAGLLLAWLALGALLPLAPPQLPRLGGVTLNTRVATFAVVVGLLSALITGAVSSLVLSRLGDRALLSSGGRGPTGGGEGFRRIVAGLQVALAVVSAVGAGLLIRTVVAMDRLDPGLSVVDMTAVDLRIPYDWNAVPESYFAALEAVVADLESRPGVIAARPTLGPPLQQRIEVVLSAAGQSEDEVRENPFVAIDAVMPGHFRAMGIPILAGRGLTQADNRPEADPIVIVDEVLAAALWPEEEPIGKQLSAFASDTWFTVVGVAGETRYREFFTQHPRAYYPLRRLGNSPPAALLVRTAEGTRASMGALVRDALNRADPEVAVMDVRPMSEILREPTVGRRFAASVLVSFALATLLLAALGVYGAFTVSVEERTRELGVRRALGAQRGGIVALVLLGILKVASVGAAAGLVAALFAGQLVESLLFGVAPVDVATLVSVLAGSLLLATCAGLAPALQASSTDPAVSLRAD